jgi:hypothetical protein
MRQATDSKPAFFEHTDRKLTYNLEIFTTKRGNVHTKVILRLVCVTIVAMERQ